MNREEPGSTSAAEPDRTGAEEEATLYAILAKQELTDDDAKLALTYMTDHETPPGVAELAQSLLRRHEMQKTAKGDDSAPGVQKGALVVGPDDVDELERRAKDFDPGAVSKGIRVEIEHTDDPGVALKIAIDHLSEDPRYYDKLEKMEGEPA